MTNEEKELMVKARKLIKKLSADDSKVRIVDFNLARLAGVKTLKLYMLRGMVNAYELGKKEAIKEALKEVKND